MSNTILDLYFGTHTLIFREYRNLTLEIKVAFMESWYIHPNQVRIYHESYTGGS